MRYLRLVVGSLVIIGALYIIVAEQVTGASSDAFVNAPLVTVRAPVAGEVTLSPRAVGAEVSLNTVLFSVTDSRADRVRLNDLILERDKAEAEIARLEARKSAVEQRRDRLSATYEDYATARLRELRRKAGDTVELPLRDPGAESATPAPNATDQVVSRDDTLDGPLAAPTLLGFQIDAARREIFLDDSAGAAWNYAYWSGAARLEATRIQNDLVAAKAVLAAYEERIDRERERLIGLTAADVTAPAAGVIWDKMTADGVTVQRGDPVVQVADCASSVVSLSVSEIVYNRLRTGDPAAFRLSGEDNVMQGTVARLAGSGAATIYDSLAVKPSREHLERYDVTLIVPELRRAPMSEGCGIGRTGRVFFEDRPLDPLRRLLN
jgi:multidrug resistance efflux pump